MCRNIKNKKTDRGNDMHEQEPGNLKNNGKSAGNPYSDQYRNHIM